MPAACFASFASPHFSATMLSHRYRQISSAAAGLLRAGCGTSRKLPDLRPLSTATSASESVALVEPASAVCACPDPATCTKCSYTAVDRAHALHPYSSMTSPLPTYPVKSASGVHLHLEDGRSLIDGMSSWWAAVHGYAHPTLDAAVQSQLSQMSHIMFGGLTHRPASELVGRLVDLTPEALTKVFLCDSGSVSVEVAMKMAVQYHYTLGDSRRTKFVSLRNGYHGDTFGAMSVCDPVNGMHSMFSGMLAQQIFVDAPAGPTLGDAEHCARMISNALEQRGEEVAAVILEPIVQGAGGMRFYHPRLLRLLREICDRRGILLIFDEIATGFCRTGTMFALEHNADTFRPWYSNMPEHELETPANLNTEDSQSQDGVVPDILCLGKAITGGYMTLGATVTTDRVAEGISGTGGVFMHGPTFMGNPLACATAVASLNLLTSSPWLDNVLATRAVLIESMAPAAELDSVDEVRVLGAIGVCELNEPVADISAIQAALVSDGIWLRPFGKLLYTMPTFNCPQLTSEHVRKIGEAICRVAAKEGQNKVRI